MYCSAGGELTSVTKRVFCSCEELHGEFCSCDELYSRPSVVVMNCMALFAVVSMQPGSSHRQSISELP